MIFILLLGGTIDVTIHEKTIGGDVVELYKASGGAWGGTKVDCLFEEYLVSILSKPVLTKVKEKYPADWVDMMRDFEKIKRSIDESNDFYSFMLKPCVCDVYQELIEVDLSKSFNNNICTRGATMRGKRRLQIPQTVIIKMLEDVADDVGNMFHPCCNYRKLKDSIWLLWLVAFQT